MERLLRVLQFIYLFFLDCLKSQGMCSNLEVSTLKADSWVVTLGLFHVFFSGLILFLGSQPGHRAL